MMPITRVAPGELKVAGQARVMGAIDQLETALKAGVEQGGPAATEALTAGRAATVAKYGAQDVLKALRSQGREPIAVYRQLTAAGDQSINLLRDVAKQAPAELPKLGRAYLDGLLDKATVGGNFEHAAKIAADWEKLGPETKRTLFKDPGYVRDLDNFFRLAKIAAENANPSGTAHTLLGYGQIAHTVMNPIGGLGEVVGFAGLSKFLHSSAGVRLLTEGIRLPSRAPGARAAWRARVVRFAAMQGIPIAVETQQSR